MHRCLLAEFDLVAGRAGVQDGDEGLSKVRHEFPTALIELTYEEMVQMSSVRLKIDIFYISYTYLDRSKTCFLVYSSLKRATSSS
jgi:hypothetical protein